MVVVLFSIAGVIRETGRIHDETAGAMVLFEAVEKGRHEKELGDQEAAAFSKRNRGLLLSSPSYEVEIESKAGKKKGKARSGNWKKEITMTPFRPETFLRRVTVIKNLGENDED